MLVQLMVLLWGNEAPVWSGHDPGGYVPEHSRNQQQAAAGVKRKELNSMRPEGQTSAEGSTSPIDSGQSQTPAEAGRDLPAAKKTSSTASYWSMVLCGISLACFAGSWIFALGVGGYAGFAVYLVAEYACVPLGFASLLFVVAALARREPRWLGAVLMCLVNAPCVYFGWTVLDMWAF